MNSKPVKFYNDYVKVSDDGIELTRSRFPYKHLDFKDIEDVRITNGYLIKNRIPVLIISSILIIVLAYFVDFLIGSNIIPEFFEKEGIVAFLFVGSRPVLAILVLALTICFLMYQAFIKSKIMVIKTNGDKYSIRLRELDNDNQVEELQNFLSDKLSV
jgi:hypothetical protein